MYKLYEFLNLHHFLHHYDSGTLISAISIDSGILRVGLDSSLRYV